MPRRAILTDRQRSALLDLPTDEPSLRKHYTLADNDFEHIAQRRCTPLPSRRCRQRLQALLSDAHPGVADQLCDVGSPPI